VNRNANRVGAVCAIGGSAVLLVGTLLHPMRADPNDAAAAFAEYAADRFWVATHLTQLAGVASIVAALLILARQLPSANAKVWSPLASAAAVASLALAAALQAVDGVALKALVDAWAAAAPSQKDLAFHAAFAVRQVEVGLASMLCILLGVTAALYGVVLRGQRRYPAWLAGLAIVGGIATVVAGVVSAHAGFSALAMAISMPASFILLVWMLALGAFMWRQGTRKEIVK